MHACRAGSILCKISQLGQETLVWNSQKHSFLAVSRTVVFRVWINDHKNLVSMNINCVVSLLFISLPSITKSDLTDLITLVSPCPTQQPEAQSVLLSWCIPLYLGTRILQVHDLISHQKWSHKLEFQGAKSEEPGQLSSLFFVSLKSHTDSIVGV